MPSFSDNKIRTLIDLFQAYRVEFPNHLTLANHLRDGHGWDLERLGNLNQLVNVLNEWDLNDNFLHVRKKVLRDVLVRAWNRLRAELRGENDWNPDDCYETMPLYGSDAPVLTIRHNDLRSFGYKLVFRQDGFREACFVVSNLGYPVEVEENNRLNQAMATFGVERLQDVAEADQLEVGNGSLFERPVLPDGGDLFDLVSTEGHKVAAEQTFEEFLRFFRLTSELVKEFVGVLNQA